MASLTWEQVVKYTFLADFDILRDTRAEVQSQPWTRPLYRLAMDTYFKIEQGKTSEQAEEDLLLAVQMKLYRQQRGRFDDDHRDNFRRLTKMKGFTGSISPGRAVETLGDIRDVDEMEDSNTEEEEELARPDESDDEGIEAHEETVSGLLYQVSMVAIDDITEPLGDNK
ncbi:hypothetical protein B0H14DRAFT_2589907 [Mycena olivaceomarginata]|nr:hypothetical protein B0H14DRAFT_2589907 [Mycena olivaceomarginata]